MNIFDSFVTWLKDVFKPLIDLYNEDSTTFFVGAIFVVLLILIIVIVLARRAEDDEKRASKKIKYDDIDWSVPGENAAVQGNAKAAAVKQVPSSRPADAYEAAVSKSYGIGEVDVDKNTFGHEGLSPEVTEALMNSVRADRENGFAVPMWMTKQTLSLDDIELQDAQEWVEEQLREKEAKAHDRQVEKATVERIAEILEKIDLCDKAKEDYKKRQAEIDKTNPPAEGEKIDLDEIAPLEPETEEKGQGTYPEQMPEVQAPVDTIPEEEPEMEVYVVQDHDDDLIEVEPEASALHDSDTLAKILREAEEIRAEGYTDEQDETGPGDSEDEEPAWGIAETLARLEAMQNENDSLLREIEADAALPEDFGEKKADKDMALYDQDIVVKADLPEEEPVPAVNEAAYRPEPQMRLSKKGNSRRFGLRNRDTNRSGRKFTEEELMKQIRD